MDDQLRKRITETISRDRVMLFMKGNPAMPQCGFSAAVVGILKEVGVPFGSFNILADQEMREGERPDGLAATEILVLHDPEAEQSVVILFFENDDDYQKGDEMLSAMPAGDTPGRRASVRKYDVATRVTA